MNKEKLVLTTTGAVGEDHLDKYTSVRAWYLCGSEASGSYKPLQTTSVKMYMDDTGVAYLAGDYILDKDGNQIKGFCQKVSERNATITYQSLQEKETKVVFQKDVGVSGGFAFASLEQHFTGLGLNVVQAKRNNNKPLTAAFAPVEEAGVFILTDTFDKESLQELMQALNNHDSPCVNLGAETINAVADAYNTSVYIKELEMKESSSIAIEVFTGDNGDVLTVTNKKPLYEGAKKSEGLEHYLDIWWENKMKVGGQNTKVGKETSSLKMTNKEKEELLKDIIALNRNWNTDQVFEVYEFLVKLREEGEVKSVVEVKVVCNTDLLTEIVK